MPKAPPKKSVKAPKKKAKHYKLFSLFLKKFVKSGSKMATYLFDFLALFRSVFGLLFGPGNFKFPNRKLIIFWPLFGAVFDLVFDQFLARFLIAFWARKLQVFWPKN